MDNYKENIIELMSDLRQQIETTEKSLLEIKNKFRAVEEIIESEIG